MIEHLPDMPPGVLGFKASGEITEADYRTVLIPAVQSALDAGDARILYRLDDDVTHMTPGAMWEDMKLGLANWSGWKRLALVTDSRGLRETAGALGWMMPGEVRTFTLGEQGQAASWLAS